MSKLSQIFDNEETTPTQKLDSLIELVSGIRTKYGNTEMEITAPYVNSTGGLISIQYLSVEDKLVVAKQELHSITSVCIEAAQEIEGVVLDREIESLIAINPILVNLGSTVESEYL